MRHIFHLVFCVATLSILSVGVKAATAGLALMKIEQGARPVGMGAAFVSITDDPNATYFNPAAAITTHQFQGSFTHTEHWQNIKLEAFHYGVRLSDRWTLHGGLRYAAINDLEGRLDIPSDDPLYQFNSHDAAFKAGLAWQAANRIAVGAAAGWFLESIEGYRGSSFNVDLGVLAQVNEAIAVGASAVNLGSSFNLAKAGQIGSRDISLPTTYRVGGSYRYSAYLGSLDFVYLDDELHAHIGAEAQIQEYFQLRAGYMFNYDTKNFSAGASFTKHDLSIDYAFVPFTKNLGTSHQFSVTFRL
jgi:hypothetical protein